MQGKKLLLSAVSGVATLFIAMPVFAEMSVPYGWYLEGNVGRSRLSNTNYNSATGGSNIGGNANLGYKFMPFFAAEVGYTMYANTIVKNGAGAKSGNVREYSYDIAGKGIIPISGSGFEAFAKLGMQRINSNVSITGNNAGSGISGGSHNSTGLYLGVGGQYYFTPELAGVAQWQRAQGGGSTGNLDLYSLGVSYIFG